MISRTTPNAGTRGGKQWHSLRLHALPKTLPTRVAVAKPDSNRALLGILGRDQVQQFLLRRGDASSLALIGRLAHTGERNRRRLFYNSTSRAFFLARCHCHALVLFTDVVEIL